MRKKQHKSLITIHRQIAKGKYKAVRVQPAVDTTKNYEIRPDGWRRKRKYVKNLSKVS